MHLSVQKHRHLDAIELVRRQREDRSQTLLFGSRPFLLCGLPIRRPPEDVLVHRRRNGRYFLEVCGHPDYGLPFGQDRLVPIWVATQAVRQGRREFTFGTGSEILSELGLPPDGPHYKRILAGFKRIFASTIFFGTESQLQSAKVWECDRFCFFDRLKLWDANVASPQKENRVVLSELFWKELHDHPIPVEREVVRALSHAPGPLDFYMWLAWRSYGCKSTQRIPLFGDAGLINQLGHTEHRRPRDFRKTVRRLVDTVAHFWPMCPAQLDSGGRVLIVQPARVIHNGL